MTFIYGLVDPTTGIVRYVGKADDPRARLAKHLRDRRPCHRVSWIRKLARLGLVPNLVILETVEDTVWKESESRWIKHFRDQGVDLTNATDGGEGIEGYHPTQATRLRMSQAKSNISDETRRRLSEAHKGQSPSEGARMKLSLTFAGRQFSEATRRKISAAKMGNKGPLGHKRSEATRLKMSQAQARRKPVSEETRKRMSDSAKRRHAAKQGRS